MGQKDHLPPHSYRQDVQQLLDDPLALSLPADILEAAVTGAYRRGLEAREAAVHICHEHSRRLCQQLIERRDMASDLMEFAIASRIDECGNLARELDQDLLDLLPDLPDFVRQPCLSDEFREMIVHIATWHGIPEHRWGGAATQLDLTGRATI